MKEGLDEVLFRKLSVKAVLVLQHGGHSFSEIKVQVHDSCCVSLVLNYI